MFENYKNKRSLRDTVPPPIQTPIALCSLREQLEILEFLKVMAEILLNFDPNLIISILAGAKP